MMYDDAKVQISDVIIIAVVSIAMIALAPVYYDLIERITLAADPLSALLLQLIIPLIFLGLVISIGVSARRRD